MSDNNSKDTNDVSASDHNKIKSSDDIYLDKNLELALKNIREKKGLQSLFQELEEAKVHEIVSTRPRGDMTLLHYAVLMKARQAVIDLLIYGADVHAKDSSGNLPIHYTRNTFIAKLLIQHNSDVNALDDLGYTLLTKAYIYDNIDLVKFLLEKKVDAKNFKEYCKLPEDYDYDKLLDVVLSGAYDSDE